MPYNNYQNYFLFVNKKMTKFMRLAKPDAEQHSIFSVGNILGKHISYDIFHAKDSLPEVFRNNEKVTNPNIIKSVLTRAAKFCFKENGIYPGTILKGIPIEECNKVLKSKPYS